MAEGTGSGHFIPPGPRFIVATNTTCKQRIEVTYHEVTFDIAHSTLSYHLAGIGSRRSGSAWPSRSLLHRIRGGQAAFGAGHRGAVHHGLADFGDHRIWPAGACRRHHEADTATARLDRRACQLRASAGPVLPGQRQLRHLGLRRAVWAGLALWPRRSRLWLGADPWRD